jgi:gliding motility-associated-like protein/uncharacterized repeat protein (TIGR01451 family)
MFKKPIGFLFGMLLFFMTSSFAQSTTSQTVYIAKGAYIKLKANSTDAIKYQWLKDKIHIVGENMETYTATNQGSYTVISYNEGDCGSDESDPVIVIVKDPLATADLMVTKSSESRAVTVNETFEYNLKVKNNGPDGASLITVSDALPAELVFEQFINPLVGSAKYDAGTKTVNWKIPTMAKGEIANLKIKVRAISRGIIKNTATATAYETDPAGNNNTSTDTKPIIGVTIPNVFTPNNDGKNDFFKIDGLSDYETNELVIINRWQSTVYEKKGYLNDWTANGLSDGTYFYVLKLKKGTSEWQELRGYITVVR